MAASPSRSIPSLAELKRELPRQGFALERGAKHTKVMRGGQQVAVLPRTAGRETWQAARNSIATLRRAGFEWPPPADPLEARLAAIATEAEEPLMRRMRDELDGSEATLAELARALAMPPEIVRRYMAGQSSLSRGARALIERWLDDRRAAPAAEAPYYRRIGLASAREYDRLLRARHLIDVAALRQAVVERGGGTPHHAADLAGISHTSLRSDDARPTLPTLEKMLRFINRPLAAFLPESLRGWAAVLEVWPTGLTAEPEEDVPFGAPPEPAEVMAAKEEQAAVEGLREEMERPPEPEAPGAPGVAVLVLTIERHDLTEAEAGALVAVLASGTPGLRSLNYEWIGNAEKEES